MMFSAKTRYLLVSGAILLASAIQLWRGYRPVIVIVGALAFLLTGNFLVYISGSRERAVKRQAKRDYYAGVALLMLLGFGGHARAQLLQEPPLPAKVRRQKPVRTDLEWMWQYTPPPAEGREREFLQDPHFRPFVEQYFTAPQSFWGPGSESKEANPGLRGRKSLPDTVEDFLAVPAAVVADENRYVTVTGAVRRMPTSRGLIFADLNNAKPLVVFAAIDWIRDGRPLDDPDAQFTLWIFVNQPPGPQTAPSSLPPALVRSLTRWMSAPLAGSGRVEKVTAAVLVGSDGTPQQIAVPVSAASAEDSGPVLTKRK